MMLLIFEWVSCLRVKFVIVVYNNFVIMVDIGKMMFVGINIVVVSKVVWLRVLVLGFLKWVVSFFGWVRGWCCYC